MGEIGLFPRCWVKKAEIVGWERELEAFGGLAAGMIQ